ncbi:type II toxin-antitoxin system PemK/MazF family toxin [Neisseriaceae bacterium ESL0693]|nr:type II toxin-antitoxin system PemK/MazF family toxin [Neisseriaceae bacterium ESL0693]
MKRGDIYLVDLEPTSGHEQRGHRPVLIVTTEAFNILTQCPVILPITNGGGFSRRVGFAVPICGSGIKTTGVIRCDQPRVIDLSARNARKVETLPLSILDEVLATVSALFQ